MGERVPPHPPRGDSVLDASLATLLQGAAQAMLLTDQRGRILLANERASALLERAPEELVGGDLPHFILPRDRTPLGDGIRQSIERQSAVADIEATIIHPRGAGGLVTLTFLPFDGPTGTRILLLLRDLTLEREARDRGSVAERAAERAEAADLRKLADLGRVTSGIVHEVKTPLTYVNNNLSLLHFLVADLKKRHPDLAAELEPLAESAGAAKQGADRITRLLFDLRPLSQNRRIERKPEDLAEVVMDGVRTFRGTHKGTTRIAVDLQSTLRVPLDRDEIVQVLLNLMNNAAAAMGDGGEIVVSTRDRDTPPEIRVRDHGPGIRGPLRDRLFQPFATEGKRDGTGLGLFISRRIVESHGGSLLYEDAEGGGACFVIRFPTP